MQMRQIPHWRCQSSENYVVYTHYMKPFVCHDTNLLYKTHTCDKPFYNDKVL
jgi:hypothetical protein